MNSDDLARFRKICGMMSSSHDGERSTAAAMATALLKKHGMTWDDVTPVAGAGASTKSNPRPQYTKPNTNTGADDDWDDDEWDDSDQPSITEFDMDRSDVERRLKWYLNNSMYLEPRTREFFNNLLRWRGNWSGKQYNGAVKSLRRSFMSYLNGG